MTKINKDTAREKFRNSVSIKDIHSVECQDRNYDYKYVAATFTEGLKRIDRYIDNGWEVVYSKEKPKDDRSGAAAQDGKDTDLRTSPVQMTTRGGQTMILMRVPKETRIKNGLDKAARDKARYLASQKRKVVEKGNTISVSDEIDFNDKSDD